jgi:hypothetical protein
MPIVISINNGKSQLYLPSTGSNSHFENSITSTILDLPSTESNSPLEASIASTSSELFAEEKKRGVVQKKGSSFRVLELGPSEEVKRRLEEIKKKISEDEVLKSVGLKPSFVVISSE